MDINFDSSEYRRARKSYVTQCTLEHLIVCLVGDAFLAKLLAHLGLSDAMIGVVTTFATLAFVFQLFSILIVQSKLSTKKIVILFDVISQSSFMLAFFVPLLPISDVVKKLLVMLAVMAGHAGKSLILTLYFKWGNSFVRDDNRAVFSANKECISLICGMIFTAVMGFFVDKFESIGNIKGGFLFVAIAMLVINIANFISLMLIPDESKNERDSMRVKTSEVIHHIFENKLFFRYILIGIIGSFSGGLLTGFIGIYKIKDLAISLLAVQIINISADFLRMIVSRPFARYSQKNGYIKGIQLSEIMVATSYAIIIVTTPQTRWLIILYSLICVAAQAGSYQNSFNIGYTLLPQKYMTQAMAIKRTVGALVSFFTAILGGQILNAIQANGNMILGIHIYAQQFLALVSLPIYVIMIILQQKLLINPLEKLEKEKSHVKGNAI